MSKYVVKRVLLMIPTILGAGILVFLMMRLLPGDICLIRIAGDGMGVSDEALARCRAEFGLDKPLWAQFIDFAVGYATFDFGKSMWTTNPITHEIGLRFQLSLQIAIMARSRRSRSRFLSGSSPPSGRTRGWITWCARSRSPVSPSPPSGSGS